MVSEIHKVKGLQCRLTINDLTLKYYLEIQIAPYTLDAINYELMYGVQIILFTISSNIHVFCDERYFAQIYKKLQVGKIRKPQFDNHQRGIISTIENRSTAI